MKITGAVERFSEIHLQSKFPELSSQNKRIVLIAGVIFLAVFLLTSLAFLRPQRRKWKKLNPDSDSDLTPLPPPSRSIKNAELEAVNKLEESLRRGSNMEQQGKDFDKIMELVHALDECVCGPLIDRWEFEAQWGNEISMQLLIASNAKVSTRDFAVVQKSYNAIWDLLHNERVSVKDLQTQIELMELGDRKAKNWLEKLVKGYPGIILAGYECARTECLKCLDVIDRKLEAMKSNPHDKITLLGFLPLYKAMGKEFSLQGEKEHLLALTHEGHAGAKAVLEECSSVLNLDNVELQNALTAYKAKNRVLASLGTPD